MSAPLRLTSQDLQRLAGFLSAMTAATAEYGMRLGAYGPVDLQVTEDNSVSISWDPGIEGYIVDDRIGS